MYHGPMDISDALLSSDVPFTVKRAILDLMGSNQIRTDLMILKPTATNDDINGSQHARNGGTDFTYEDADLEDVAEASSLGYYEYFRSISSSGSPYTGNQYHGEGYMFAALVVDPPAYAAEIHI